MSDDNNNNNKNKDNDNNKNKDEININNENENKNKENKTKNDKITNNKEKNVNLNITEKDKSKENIIWTTNPMFNLKLSPLQRCKDKKTVLDISRNTTDLSCNITDFSNNVIIPKSNNQKSIKTCDNNLNMTIKKILDKMNKERKENNNEVDDFFSKSLKI